MKAVHGPFHRTNRAYKRRILETIQTGKCPCELCEEAGRSRPMPKPMCWSRRPSNVRDPEGAYVCRGPSKIPMTEGVE